MPKVIVDTTNVPDSDRQTYEGPIPPAGLYKARFKKAWWTKTNDKSKTMLKLLFILQTENAAKKQYNGYPVWHNITYEASTAWKMKELFTALRSGAKSGIEFDDKGVVTRIGRVVPDKVDVLIHGIAGMYKGKAKLEIDTLAPVPLAEGEVDMDSEDYEGEDAYTEMDAATSFDEGGGIVQEETPSDDGEAHQAPAGADPWGPPDGTQTATPDGAPAVDDEPPF